MTKPILSQKTLKKLLHYDLGTGIFTWKEREIPKSKDLHRHKSWNQRYAGKSAGHQAKRGYIELRLLGTLYLAHRLAFLYVKGRFPALDTDHIDGIRNNNKWANLREATRQENTRNACRPARNKSGHVGVIWHIPTRKWRAYISVNGEQGHLGLYEDIEDAKTARKAAEEKHGFHKNHGRDMCTSHP